MRAVGLLCDWAFENLGLGRVVTETDGDNLGSRRPLEKAGFVLDGGEDGGEVRCVLMAGDSNPA